MVVAMHSEPTLLKSGRLGTILIERRLITQNQLNHALRIQERQNGLLGKILVELGYINERDIVVALVVQCHIPYIAINEYDVDASVIELVPGEIAHKYRVVPLDRVNRILSVVMADPLNIEAKIEIQNATHCRLMPFIATQGEIEKAIHRWYDN
jgi:type IV pilus assembly protein PilB